MIGKTQLFSSNLIFSQRNLNRNKTSKDTSSDKFVKLNNYVSFKSKAFTSHIVIDGYMRGSKPDFEDLMTLKNFGVRTVIDLIGDDSYNRITKLGISGSEISKRNTERLGLKYINLPLKDNEPPSNEQIVKFLKILKDKSNGTVFVHCREGKDRTGLMSAIYLLENFNFGFEYIYQDMLEKGHDFYGNYKLDNFFEDYYINNFSKKRNQDTEYIKILTNRIRKNRFFLLNNNVYDGKLTINNLENLYK